MWKGTFGVWEELRLQLAIPFWRAWRICKEAHIDESGPY